MGDYGTVSRAGEGHIIGIGGHFSAALEKP
jgi:hypothetical protein